MGEKPLAQTPPMGWNSWNMFGPAVNEDKVRNIASALVRTGMKDLGYNYVVIDDCWSVRNKRDGNGDLIADPDKFPNGMKALADYVHDLGLRIGIYSDAAELTCAGYPGSYGNEKQDAELWASWGFDFLKYDYCNAPDDQATAIERYSTMGSALVKTEREFLYSICEWGGRNPHLWGRKVGGHMWRVSGDVFDSWSDVWVKPENHPGYYGIGIDSSLELAARLSEYGKPGGFNDLDMLVVGLKGKGQIEGGGLNRDEYRTHMSLWSMASSPLMIGCDITEMDRDTESILTNKLAIAINQDPSGTPGRRVCQRSGCDIWRKELSDGTTAAAIINRNSHGIECGVTAGDFGMLDGPKEVFSIWDNENIPEFTGHTSFTLRPHETKFLVLRQ